MSDALPAPSAGIEALVWPLARCAQGLEALARQSNYLPIWDGRRGNNQTGDLPLPRSLAQAGSPLSVETLGQLDRWLGRIAADWGLEVEAVQATYAGVDPFIQRLGPGLLLLPAADGQPPGFLLILKKRWGRMAVIGPDNRVRYLRPDHIRQALCADLEAPFMAQVDQILGEAAIAEERQPAVKAALLRQSLGARRLGGAWLLRLPPGVSMVKQIRQTGLGGAMLGFLGGHILGQVLWIFSWWTIGRDVLVAQFNLAWVMAWGLILLTTIPFQLWGVWSRSVLVTRASVLFKQRLLYGALQLDPEAVRSEGTGHFFGRVLASETVASLGADQGVKAFLALVELILAAIVLTLGVGGVLHAYLLGGWFLVTLLLGWLYFRQSRAWSELYRGMTNDLVERLVGHRTRLAQEDKAHWHAEEDQVLADYLERSSRLDRLGVQLNALVPRGWLLFGLLGIAYALIFTPLDQVSLGKLAISLGGILLAAQALEGLIAGLHSLINMGLAWQQIGPLYQAAARPKETASLALAGDEEMSPSAGITSTQTETRPFLMAARELSFRYPRQAEPVLRRCRLQINGGDRLLLQGPSGTGKSTLVSLLTGLRHPTEGILLLKELDRRAWGYEAWRQRVVAAPQFHENHILTETLAFNLLLGRGWPPAPEDLAEAEAVCRELGLGDLLDRMPLGLQQVVGEGGWRLSHGEQGRLFIARTLLQKADLIVLDENFTALDPETMQQALRCVFKRAPTLLVVTHP